MLNTNASDEPLLQAWLNDEKFHEITEIAIEGRIMIIEDIDLTIGAAKGATTIVKNIKRSSTNGLITSIHIVITFPIALVNIITRHKAQGCTILTKAMVVIREAFIEGLAYVMLSRVTTRQNLHI